LSVQLQQFFDCKRLQPVVNRGAVAAAMDVALLLLQT